MVSSLAGGKIRERSQDFLYVTVPSVRLRWMQPLLDPLDSQTHHVLHLVACVEARKESLRSCGFILDFSLANHLIAEVATEVLGRSHVHAPSRAGPTIPRRRIM
jgi:hypothetical protein